MRQKKKWLFVTSILAVVMLGTVQSLTAQNQKEPTKTEASGQQLTASEVPSSHRKDHLLTQLYGQQPKASETPAPTDQQKPKKLNPFTGNEEAIKEGRQLYLQSGCPGCHGSGGGGAMAGATPFTGDRWKFGGDDDTFFKVTKGTYPGQTMPAVFGATLTDEQIWKIIAWIRTVYKGDPSSIVW